MKAESERGRSADAETVASYERAGFGTRSTFGRQPALLVVDMCQAYFAEESPLYLGRPEVAASVGRVVAAARSSSIPVLWTRVEYEPGGTNGGVWYEKVRVLSSFDRGNPLGDWLPDLEPAADEVVVTKQHASGFFGTDLADRLAGFDVDSVFVVGVSTSGCVRATATDASASGFRPFVIGDGVGDRTERVHNANLFDLNAKYADVITEGEALAELRRLKSESSSND